MPPIIKITAALIATIICSFTQPATAQRDNDGHLQLLAQLNNIYSHGENAPFWLTARRQGVSSIESRNGYMRLAATYGNSFGRNRNFSYRITADILACYNQYTPVVVHQAYGDISWKWLTLSIGSKERYSELKGDDNLFSNKAFANSSVNRVFPGIYNKQITNLSSGGLTYSGNSRPIPQVRIEVPRFTTIGGTNGWLHMRGHIAYGRFTDYNFQRDFSQGNSITRYGHKILYHSKAAFIRVGKLETFPLDIEAGCEMYSQFGGDIYKHGKGVVTSMPHKLSDYFKAFIPLSGSDDTPIDEQTNISGNQIGSWHAAITWHTKPIDIRIYGEHMFEDFSQLFFFEYQSNKEGKRRIIYYPWKDIMLGIRLTNKSDIMPFISSLQYEYMGTYDQSGALYHDPSINFNEQMDGVDNYYNHGIYPGWHHWGMGIGNPLIVSPQYNTDGNLAFKSNRLISHNVGINGTFGKRFPFAYRLQYTYSKNWGTYLNPFRQKTNTNSLLGEIVFAPQGSNWSGSVSLGYDHSNHIGNNIGFMVSITHVGTFLLNKGQ